MSAILLSAATATLMFLPLDQLEANEFALRGVDLEDPKFLELADNVAVRGVRKTISVRPSTLGDKKSPKLTPDGRQVYSVIDGLQRYTAAKLAKLESVPCCSSNETDEQVELSQIMDNLHVIPMHAYEYAAGLKKALQRDTTISLSEMANRLNVSEEFIEARMGLLHLHKDGVDEKGDPTSTIGAMVDAKLICLGNAVALATLKPSEEQLAFVDQAKTQKTEMFAKLISDRKRDLKKAKQSGKTPGEKVEWSPSAHYRKKSDVELECTTPNVILQLARAKGIDVSPEATRFILQYVLQLDEQSVIAQKAEHDASEKARLEKLAVAKVERDRLKKIADDAVEAAKAAATPKA